MTLEASGAQDMITGDPPPNDVPEPGTLALLGVAAAALVSTRRRLGAGSAT
ncbi:MAG: PEP-CTERM sorting domain-containing protein [Rubrivivax sp.]|nr:PEP-CTERM sorting domain-containing protein [Rubrivivax sp.]